MEGGEPAGYFTTVVKELKSGLTENESENKVLRHISLEIYFKLLDCALSFSQHLLWLYQHITQNIKLCVIQDNEKLGSITSDIKAGKGILCFYLNSHIIGFHPRAQVTCRTTCTCILHTCMSL